MPNYTNPGPIEFDAELNVQGNQVIEFPYDVMELYGVKGRVPVKVTFDGIPYQGSMVRMNSERHLLLILKSIQEQLGKAHGDMVHVRVELDDAPRTIAVPGDLAAALEVAGLTEAFESLAFTHRREHIMAIEDAKRPETRTKRIEAAIEMVRAKAK